MTIKKPNGVIFNIQRYSINDGPGIRTTVFMKGCPLDCLWCHNPESKNIMPELSYNSSKCLKCEACAMVCPNNCHQFSNNEHVLNRGNCTACGECANVCAGDALTLMGKTMTVEEVLTKVKKDELFYSESGGGMTVSGGEPFMQYPFLYELVRTAKKSNLHICLETCGYTDFDKLQKIAPYVDTFLYDYKETNDSRHKEYTGVSNKRILKNLEMLNKIGADIILRCPLIMGYNDRTDHFEGIAAITKSYKNIRQVDVEPYHPLGKAKSQDIGKDYPLGDIGFVDKELVTEWIQQIQSQTLCPIRKV